MLQRFAMDPTLALLICNDQQATLAVLLKDFAIFLRFAVDPRKIVLLIPYNPQATPAVLNEEIAMLQMCAMDPRKIAQTSTPKPPTSPNADRTTITADLLTLPPQPFLPMPASPLEETTTAPLVLIIQEFRLEPLLHSPNNHILNA